MRNVFLLFFILRVSLYGVLHVWIRERARCSESCVLIGYQSGQDRHILPTRDVSRWSRKKKFSFWPYNKSFIDQAGWRWLYIGLVFSLGTLSSDVFEPRASTGSGLLALLSRGFEQTFGQIVSKRVKTLSNTNLVTLRHTKREKGSLPFDLRQSKTSLLKLPIDRDETWPISSHLTARSPKVWPSLISSHSFMQTLTNQKSKTVSSGLLIGLNLYEGKWISETNGHTFRLLAVSKQAWSITDIYCNAWCFSEM